MSVTTAAMATPTHAMGGICKPYDPTAVNKTTPSMRPNKLATKKRRAESALKPAMKFRMSAGKTGSMKANKKKSNPFSK